jgi:hypothetical protein
MERVDLTKKGYMMWVFSVRKKKLHAKQTPPQQTDSRRASRAQDGIQVESKAHRRVAFVFTLLTFCFAQRITWSIRHSQTKKRA